MRVTAASASVKCDLEYNRSLEQQIDIADQLATCDLVLVFFWAESLSTYKLLKSADRNLREQPQQEQHREVSNHPLTLRFMYVRRALKMWHHK